MCITECRPLCVNIVRVSIHVDACLFLALPQDTPQPLLSLRGGGWGASPLPRGLPSPSLPCPAVTTPQRAQAPLCLKARAPEQVSRAGQRLARHNGCPLRAARWGTLGRKLAEPQDPGGHGREAGDRPGGPAAAKAPAGAGAVAGRLGADAGGNWHRAHGTARGDAVVRGLPGE